MHFFEALRHESLDISQLTKFPSPRCDAIYQLPLPGSTAMEVWRKVRQRVNNVGYSPLLVDGGSEPDLSIEEGEEEEVWDPMGELEARIAMPGPATAKEILAAAEEVPFELWVRRQRDPVWQRQNYLAKAEHLEQIGEIPSLAQLYRKFADQWRDDPPVVLTAEDYQWPQPEAQFPLQEHLAATRTFGDDWRLKQVERVLMLFVPTPHCWQIPAYLSFTALGNERPAECHTAALKWLHAHFGAELLGIWDRTLDVFPARRPRTRQEAMELAVLISTYAICPFTGDENAKPPEWAAFLMESPFWSFSWP